MENVLEIKNFTKSYGKARGVIDLSLTVKKGDIFGFMGPNGAGKSTTIRSILGLITPNSGTIKVFGEDNRTKLVDILGRIGYMPSEAMFYPNMKIDEIIKFAADVHKKDCSEEARILCDRLQVDTKKKIEELSLGNRKKVGIICAIQHKPELYIFDEPTSGLDPLMQNEFFKIIKERNEQGATFFLSSHVLSEIQNYCKNGAVIREGKLIACDSVEELAKTNARRIKLRGIDNIGSIKGAIDVKELHDSVTFLYKGNIKYLVNQLNDLSYTDLIIEEPSLEEIFMHFYEKEEQ